MSDLAEDVVTDFDIFWHELRSIPDPEFSRARVEKLFFSHRGERWYLPIRDFEWPHRLRMASHLLASGVARADAMRTLASTLEVSEATAYRILQSALDARRPSPAYAQRDLFK